MDYNAKAREFAELMAGMMHCPSHQSTAEVTRGETGLLMYLGMEHNGASAGELGDRMKVGSGRIANVLKALESKGMVVRSRSPLDRRGVQVCLTEKGQIFVGARRREFLKRMQHLMEQLGEEDTEQLFRLMRRILEIEGGPERRA